MAYVITQNCCNDASCVAVCPVDCIHPTPEEPHFLESEMLYIDPDVCIDCGACVEECPVDAIRADEDVTVGERPYLEINKAYYLDRPASPQVAKAPARRSASDVDGLRVAIVGSGPSGFYAAAELLAHKGTVVDIFERLPALHGLVRAGVAPDHFRTKGISTRFDSLLRKANLGVHLGTAVGEHVSNDELLESYHAVIYAVGAFKSQKLGIPGEELDGYIGASDFVGWYNSHPEHTALDVDLSCERAVVIGNGNVALDIARVLTVDPDVLRKTDIAMHAIDTLRSGTVREVEILGRRGPAQAAFTTPELLALSQLPDCDVIVRGIPADFTDTIDGESDYRIRAKSRLIAELADRPSSGASRRIILHFCASPTEVLGDGRVEGIRLVRNVLEQDQDGRVQCVPSTEFETLETGLIISAAGFRGTAIPGVPFDEKKGRIPNRGGRVTSADDGEVVTGVYATGWIKRGPSGVIGTNRLCAEETVAAIMVDYRSGRLNNPTVESSSLHAQLRERSSHYFDASGWRAIDLAERQAGKAAGRTRLKFVDIESMLEVAHGTHVTVR